mmetsp:Transcript_16212/g.23643  ORF Transcript_16212/g.23643 Transcript_16212/m.23643 type:complete len:271 (+) Transcript_16212:1777-2589(+)
MPCRLEGNTSERGLRAALLRPRPCEGTTKADDVTAEEEGRASCGWPASRLSLGLSSRTSWPMSASLSAPGPGVSPAWRTCCRSCGSSSSHSCSEEAPSSCQPARVCAACCWSALAARLSSCWVRRDFLAAWAACLESLVQSIRCRRSIWSSSAVPSLAPSSSSSCCKRIAWKLSPQRGHSSARPCKKALSSSAALSPRRDRIARLCLASRSFIRRSSSSFTVLLVSAMTRSEILYMRKPKGRPHPLLPHTTLPWKSEGQYSNCLRQKGQW